jgi:hypothetical protein
MAWAAAATLVFGLLTVASAVDPGKTLPKNRPRATTLVTNSGPDAATLVTALDNTPVTAAAPNAIFLCPLPGGKAQLEDGTVINAPQTMTATNSSWVLDGQVVIAEIPTVPGAVSGEESAFAMATNLHQVRTRALSSAQLSKPGRRRPLTALPRRLLAAPRPGGRSAGSRATASPATPMGCSQS